VTKTKKEIVKAISDQAGLTQLKTKEIVQQTFDAIVDTLVEHKRIELRNFGVFEVKKRAARKARNPRTGERVFVPAKYVVTFKPGKEMEERVRQLEAEDAARDRSALAVDSDTLDDSYVPNSDAAASESIVGTTAPVPGPRPVPSRLPQHDLRARFDRIGSARSKQTDVPATKIPTVLHGHELVTA